MSTYTVPESSADPEAGALELIVCARRPKSSAAVSHPAKFCRIHDGSSVR